MFKTLYTIFSQFFANFSQQLQSRVLTLAKIEIAKMYISGVMALRKAAMAFCLLFLCFMMLALGILAVPMALIYLSDWEQSTKLIVMASFGGVYILLPLAFVVSFLSESRWIKMSKVDELVAKITK